MMTPGGKPVAAVPVLTPRSPVSVDTPALVTVEPPRTAKPAAVASATGTGDAAADASATNGPNASKTASVAVSAIARKRMPGSRLAVMRAPGGDAGRV